MSDTAAPDVDVSITFVPKDADASKVVIVKLAAPVVKFTVAPASDTIVTVSNVAAAAVLIAVTVTLEPVVPFAPVAVIFKAVSISAAFADFSTPRSQCRRLLHRRPVATRSIVFTWSTSSIPL